MIIQKVILNLNEIEWKYTFTVRGPDHELYLHAHSALGLDLKPIAAYVQLTDTSNLAC